MDRTLEELTKDLKSEKAKEFLRTKQPGDIAQYEISRWKAERAVEIAEEEMIEKAAIVFSEYCEIYAGDGKCLGGGKCENCDRVNKFKRKLMER